jgi:hypothetical protein
MKKTAILLLLFAVLLSTLAFAGDTYLPGKIVKWDNGTYPDGKNMKSWVVYQLQGDNGTIYSIARHKETKPQLQAGEAVQYVIKKSTQMNVLDAKGKKHEYQIVGQNAGAGQ